MRRALFIEAVALVVFLCPLSGRTDDEPSAEPDAQESPASEEKEETDDDHEGRFFRLTLGPGYGLVGTSGRVDPQPGFKPIDGFTHGSPTLGFGLLFGGDLVENMSLAFEMLYERMLINLKEPSSMSFNLFGIGAALSYYFDSDWYLTGHLRYLLLLMWRHEMVCEVTPFDKYMSSSGPGAAVTFGKEWFGDNDRGVGIALQLGYAYFLTSEPNFHYASLSLLFSVTRF